MPAIDRRALFSHHHVLTLAVVVLAVTAGCLSFGTSSAVVTVENTDPTPYQMSAYVFTEPVGAGNVPFRVTNSTGTQKTVGLAELETDGPYYTLSLAQRWKATEQRVSVPATETTTTTFTAWDSGEAIVYVIERPSGRVVQTEFAGRSADAPSHTVVFAAGPEHGYEMACS
jgi:hypothetical protein